jgi:hypothetical protein
MLCALLQHARIGLATAVILSVPAFALWSLLSTSKAERELARRGDGNTHDWRLVEPPIGAAHKAQSPAVDSATEFQLNDWIFTSKGKPSPYQ